MIKKKIPAIVSLVFGLFFLSSCTVFKKLNFIANKQVAMVPAPGTHSKFIDEITVTPQVAVASPPAKTESKETFTTNALTSAETTVVAEEVKQINEPDEIGTNTVESFSSVQMKYAGLLNTEVAFLPNKVLLESVDTWYGVRYMRGGNGKNGIDCSGFTVAVYLSTFGIKLPRVSKEQYRVSRKISITELKEGDLLFFNTLGRGVSHVGIYLGNNKFIHASSTRGVAVNGLFESYYVKHFVGAGRIDDKQVVASN